MRPDENETHDDQRSEAAVDFYWRPGCLACYLLGRKLKREGVVLDKRNIWLDRDAAAFVRSVTGGFETVPTVFVAGRALVNPPASTVLGFLWDTTPTPPG